MNLLYLGMILFSICGMVLLDYRYRLAFFAYPKRTALILLLSVAAFLLWDVAGINLGIFFIGETSLLSNITLAPELPIEEVFFLFFLSYFTLILWRRVECSRRKRHKEDIS